MAHQEERLKRLADVKVLTHDVHLLSGEPAKFSIAAGMPLPKMHRRADVNWHVPRVEHHIWASRPSLTSKNFIIVSQSIVLLKLMVYYWAALIFIYYFLCELMIYVGLRLHTADRY